MLKVIILLAHLTSAIFAQCQDGFENVGGSCYKFVYQRDNEMNYEEAQTECRKLGDNVNLASIRCDAENDAVYEMVKSNTAYMTASGDENQEETWIGLHNLEPTIAASGEWFNDKHTSYRNFADNEPNNKGIDSMEACVFMRLKTGNLSKWNDFGCKRRLMGAACEEQTATSGAGCETTTTDSTTTTTTTTTTTSTTETTTTTTTTTTKTTTTTTTTTTATTTTIKKQQKNEEEIDINNPSNGIKIPSIGIEIPPIALPGGNGPVIGLPIADSTSTERTVISGGAGNLKCQDGFTNVGGSCYKFLLRINSTYAQAQDVCNGLGSNINLATIRCDSENAAIFELMKADKEYVDLVKKLDTELFYQKDARWHRLNAWIGLHNTLGRKDSGVWYGRDKDSTYRRFALNEPNNYGNHETCVEIIFQDKEEGHYSHWNDLSCDYPLLGVVCEQETAKSGDGCKR